MAEPRLLTVTGQSANIALGGQTPILTNANGQRTVSYKNYGTNLQFVPSLTATGKIRLEVVYELSDLNHAKGITLRGDSGTTVLPGFDVSYVKMAGDLEAGQTLAIGGFIQKTSVPLDRNTSREIEEEVIILVTPRLK